MRCISPADFSYPPFSVGTSTFPCYIRKWVPHTICNWVLSYYCVYQVSLMLYTKIYLHHNKQTFPSYLLLVKFIFISRVQNWRGDDKYFEEEVNEVISFRRRERSRERDHSRSREKSRRHKSRSRDRHDDYYRERSRERERHRDRDRDRDRERDREREYRHR